MTTAQFEQRLIALEKTVARLQAQIAERTEPAPKEEDIIPGAEYDLTTTLQPTAEFHIRAKIVAIEKPPARLGLSDAEWAGLPLEDENE